jgi:cobalt-zinc-cadmium efflux system protein
MPGERERLQMSAAHSHASTGGGAHKKRLQIVLSLTAVYLAAEVIGAYLTHSLALFAEAGHMLTDVTGLAFALLAIRFAEKPATPERTYGFYRVEILAALLNALVLICLSFYILFEAYKRLHSPPEVQSGLMLVVASIGLAVNVTGVLLLRSGSQESLNVKSAYFEVLSDMLTAIGVIVAALIMLKTGWYYADPLISAGIGLFILPRTWVLLREAVGVLLEGTPADVNLASIRQRLAELPGVKDVHDLHVWTLTSGVNAMSAHLVIIDDGLHNETLSAAHETLTFEFKIAHATVQIECDGWRECESHF